MFNLFPGCNFPSANSHHGNIPSNARPGENTTGRQGNIQQVDPLLTPLAGTDACNQAPQKGRMKRLREYFTQATTSTPTGATASASASSNPSRLPAVTGLIHRIKTCEPAEAAAVTADLHQALHLGNATPRLAIPTVREMLKSADWIDLIIAGQLDLASLLPVIGHVTDLEERRALMGAIEAAIQLRQNTDPVFAARMNDRLGVPDTAPRLSADALQAKVKALYRNPQTRRHIDSIATMFRKLGPGTVPAQVIAANLGKLFNRMDFCEEIPHELKAEVMPRLIEDMLHRGHIDRAHARIARLAAARVHDYILLTHRDTEANPTEPTPLKLPVSGRLVWACIDERWLQRRLEDPDAYAGIVPVNHRHGKISPTFGLKMIGDDLLNTIDEMEAAGFLQATTLARLRTCLPHILDAIFRENCKYWPEKAKAGATLAPNSAELMQRLETLSPTARLQLMEDLMVFFRTGTMVVEGAAFIQRHGDAMSVLLTDSALARSVMARLKQLEREKNNPGAQTTTGSGSS